jgi:hypothetical protein
MTTDWGFGCEDCGVREHYEGLRRSNLDLLARALRCAGVIAEAQRALDVAGGPRLAFELTSSWNDSADAVSFLATHAGHKLRLMDEYGNPLEACPYWGTCGCGKSRNVTCGLAWDHASPCTFRCDACVRDTP